MATAVHCLLNTWRSMRQLEKAERERASGPRKYTRWWRSSSLEQTEENIEWNYRATPEWSLRECTARYVLQWFPHVTDEITWQAAEEYGRFGHVDSENRGISTYEWLWKRSRFLAGYR